MILVCGEALCDVFAGEPLADGTVPLTAIAGGSPFNVAIGLARLGTPSALLAGISRDMFGRLLAERLAQEGVALDYLIRSAHRTTLSLVGLDEQGAPSYSFYGEGAADRQITSADLPALPPEITALHLGSYAIAVPPVADALATLAERERHRCISLDPNVRLNVEPSVPLWRERIARLVTVATLVKVSEEDLALLEPGRDPLDIARAWLAAGPELVVVTRGGQGAVALRGSDMLTIPAVPATVVDTVGAGDTFQAALLDGLSRNNALSRIAIRQLDPDQLAAVLRRAAAAASITCGRRGADLPRASELPSI